MTPVNAVFRNGKIEIAVPIEFTDGTEVRVPGRRSEES